MQLQHLEYSWSSARHYMLHYATAHTMAQHLDLALACQMQTYHERGPDPFYNKLTHSTNTGLWRATGGFHSEDSTKTTSVTSLATSEASLACPAVYTNLCVQSTPMHNKHEQPK